MATITGSAIGSNASKVQVRVYYTVTETSSGSTITATLQTGEKSGQSIGTYDNNARAWVSINGNKSETSKAVVHYKNWEPGWHDVHSHTVSVSHTAAKSIKIAAYFFIGSSYLDAGCVNCDEDEVIGSTTVTLPAKTYTVTYDANGGSGAPSPEPATAGVAYKINSTEPKRANQTDDPFTITFNANGGSCSTTSKNATNTIKFTFSNWNTASGGGGTTYNPGSSYTITGNLKLYAQYTSSTTTASVSLPTATREGYTFKGWGTNSSATTAVSNPYTPTKSLTLYAIWQVNPYTVTLTKGTGIASVSGAGTYNYGTSVTIDATLSTGYVWSGWSGTHSTTTKKYTFTMPASDVNDTANATADTYKITFDANGGSGGPGTQTKTYNKTLTISSTTPTRTGYTFLGWSTSKTATTATYSAGGSFSTNITDDITLYAVWSANTTPIPLDANGGTVSPTSITVTYNAKVPALPTPTRTGYKFLGWFTAASGGTQITTSTTYTGQFTKLYAHWEVQGGASIYTSGARKTCMAYIYTGGAWKYAIPYIYSSGTWHMGIGE